ncbi:MAG: hypothetical protein HKN87_09710 [Saprospiraceae bacterium]|nr:hypothetical protein [Saprospiraceae bacterium]
MNPLPLCAFLGLVLKSTVATTCQRTFSSLALIFVFLFAGCSVDQESDEHFFLLRINLKTEPDYLNPILSQQLTARQIERLILCPLEEYNPNTLELEPMLLEARPDIEVVKSGPQQGQTRYDMHILEEARWDDGSPVTGYDYLFTNKLAFVPNLTNNRWASYLEVIDSICVDVENPKHITVFVDQPYMRGEEIVCGFNVYPEHIYDPDSLLTKMEFRTLKGLNPSQVDPHIDTKLRDFAQQFNSASYSREKVEGCGPYRLVEWTAGQQIMLDKKIDYWADNLDVRHPLLEAVPDRLIYYVISDEQTAFTSLKDGKLDIMANLTPEQFDELNQASDLKTLQTYAPAILQYYAIVYNNDHPILSDVRVRRAISHLIDIEQIIDKMFYGQALPIVGPINPSISYYNSTLLPISLNLDSAGALLAAAGWLDHDEDGILDKNIDAKMTPLTLRIFTSQSALSQDIAVLMQLQARKLGMNIEIVPQSPTVYLPMVRKGDYEMAAMVLIQSVGDSDPYNFWHSDNAHPEGSNLTRIRHAELDQVIVDLRKSLDRKDRDGLFLRLQEIIYQQQPALFLLAPKMKIAARSDLNMTISTMRPGYFENLTTLR